LAQKTKKGKKKRTKTLKLTARSDTLFVDKRERVPRNEEDGRAGHLDLPKVVQSIVVRGEREARSLEVVQSVSTVLDDGHGAPDSLHLTQVNIDDLVTRCGVARPEVRQDLAPRIDNLQRKGESNESGSAPIDYRCDNRRFRLSAHDCQVPTPTSQNLEVEQQIRILRADYLINFLED
jgi:hypothetical protein